MNIYDSVFYIIYKWYVKRDNKFDDPLFQGVGGIIFLINLQFFALILLIDVILSNIFKFSPISGSLSNVFIIILSGLVILIVYLIYIKNKRYKVVIEFYSNHEVRAKNKIILHIASLVFLIVILFLI